MIIKVTKEDIKNGNRYDEESCPIALASKRETGCRKIIVKRKLIHLSNGCTYFLPSAAISFIREFDNTGIGTPFEFELDYEN